MARWARRLKEIPVPPQLAENEQEFEQYKGGLRKMVAFYRDKLTKTEAALAALEGRVTMPAEPRVNKAIKEFLAQAGPHTHLEVLAEMMRSGIVTDVRGDRARVARSLKQCVNAGTLVEEGGKYAVPPDAAPSE